LYTQWIDKLAKRTPGWTGAELAGLVRSATSLALSRFLQRLEQISSDFSSENFIDRKKAVDRLTIEWDDFIAAQKEVRI
jgi:SpoVK/Ycf46/Vps4 family AAA+-type ATPase